MKEFIFLKGVASVVKRRSLLGVAAVVGATATASGCLGYTVTGTAGLEHKEERLRNQSSKIDELEREVEELNATLQSANETNARLESRLDDQRERLDAARDEQILYLYGYGVTLYNRGIDFYNSGIDRLKNDDLRAARADMNAAAGYFDSAALDFGGAADRASAVEAPTVEEYASEAESKSDAIREACADYQTAIRHAANGEDSEAEKYADQGDAHYQTSSTYTIRDRSELEAELGTSIA